MLEKIKSMGRRVQNKIKQKANERNATTTDITTLNWGVDRYVYATNPYITYLNEDDNIGKMGNELTIMVLTCNRVENTITLMESVKQYIPDFAGVMLFADNASSEEQLQVLTEKIKEMPYRCEIAKLDNNYGIAGGRQRGMEYVTTKWVMFLDNDIYFTCNPLKKLQADIDLLGCHFINMPLMDVGEKTIFTNGGNFYLEVRDKETIFVNSGSVFVQGACEKNIEFETSLSTFVYGGTSVVRKDTFMNLGGFDDNMFIGFEDIDLSIRVFRAGYKIGNCGILALVHNHANVPKNNHDFEYEKKRFSNEKLKESAMYFEKKNKYKVWSKDTEDWINKRNEELNLLDK